MKLFQKLLNAFRKFVDVQILNQMYVEYSIHLKGKINTKHETNRFNSAYAVDLTKLMNDDIAVKENVFFLNNTLHNELRLNIKNLADFGCGNGIYCKIIKSLPWAKKINYIGIDKDIDLLKICRQYNDKERFIQGGVSKIKLNNQAVDLVFASGVIQYIKKTTLIKTLREIRRISKNYICITRLPTFKFHNSLLVDELAITKYGQEVATFCIWNRKEIENIFSKSHLEIISRDYSTQSMAIKNCDEAAILVQYLLRVKL